MPEREYLFEEVLSSLYKPLAVQRSLQHDRFRISLASNTGKMYRKKKNLSVVPPVQETTAYTLYDIHLLFLGSLGVAAVPLLALRVIAHLDPACGAACKPLSISVRAPSRVFSALVAGRTRVSPHACKHAKDS